MENIKLSRSARLALGPIFQQWIQAGLTEKGSGPDGWWREVEQRYRNEMPTAPDKDVVAFHIPISQPRQDSLTSNVCTVIAKQEPIMLCDLGDADLQNRRQRLIQKAWEDAGIRAQASKASTHATNINKCYFKITPKSSRTTSGGQRSSGASASPGVDIDVVHPNDMVVMPAIEGGCKSAVLVGNRLWKTLAECKQLIKEGTYYNDAQEPGTGDPGEHDEQGERARSGETLSAMDDAKLQKVQLWSCVVEFDLSTLHPEAPDGFKRYLITVSWTTLELLSLQAYPESYRHKWYFEGFYVPNDVSYWPSKSVARNLLPLQNAYNNLASLFYTYGSMAARPPMLGPKLDEEYTELHPGDYLETDEEPKAFSPTITFQGQPLVVQMQQIERIADQVARVSQNTMGSIQGRDTTATTDSIVAAGVAVGLEEYIGNFATPFPSMAEHTEDVLAGMYDEVSQYFTREEAPPAPDPEMAEEDGSGINSPVPAAAPQLVPLVSYEELRQPASWRVNGLAPSATPTAKVQAASTLAEMSENPAYGLDPYEVAGAILKNSPLAGTGNLQIPKEKVEQMMQQQAQAEAAANQPQQQAPSVSDVIDRLTERELGEVLQRDYGIQPDPRRASGELDAQRAAEAAKSGKSDGDGPGSTGGHGAGPAGPHDAAMVGAAHSPELAEIARRLAARRAA